MRTLLLLAALAVTTPAAAQVRPYPGSGDPRLQTVDYDPGQIVQLEGAPGYQLTVELSPDEQVQNVAVGDSGAWQVSVNRGGDRLFIKPTQGDAATNMTVITNVRVYNFELFSFPAPSASMAYNVRFRYPAPAGEAPEARIEDASRQRREASRYRIRGDRLVRPQSVTHDGEHTYIRWAAGRPIPAIYEISEAGQEMLVNGGMRGDEFVIDGVARRLRFRIDHEVARADIVPHGKPR